MAVINDVLKMNRQQLKALAETRGIRKLREVYEQSRLDLESRLDRLVRAGRGQEFTAHHLRMVLVQVRGSLAEFETEFGHVLGKQAKLAAELSNKHLVRSIKQLERHFTGLTPTLRVEQAGVFQGIYKDVEPALLNRFKQSTRLYTKPVIVKVRDELSKSVLQGENFEDTIDRVAGTDGIFAGERWRAERICRTETSYAYGVTNQAQMDETAEDVPGLQKKLIATFDDRTGEDSEELHGQVVDVDKPFVWHVKNSKGMPTGKVVEYMQPPNRPNDRECVIPWRASWAETAVTEPEDEAAAD